MFTAAYLRDRAIRFRDLARRAGNIEDARYLLKLATDADRQAEMHDEQAAPSETPRATPDAATRRGGRGAKDRLICGVSGKIVRLGGQDRQAWRARLCSILAMYSPRRSGTAPW